MTIGIYLMDFGDVVKVGHSKNVKRRMINLSSTFKSECVECFSWETPFAREIESSVKSAFSNSSVPFKGVVNECFTPDMMNSIKEHIEFALSVIDGTKKTFHEGHECQKINEYIQSNHDGNISKMAAALEKPVRYDQVSKWIGRNGICIDGVIYCEVARLKGLNND